MDGPGSLVTRLRQALAAFDDDALAALANKGLVRRARKDLETSHPKIIEPPAEGRLRLEIGDAVVEIANPVAQSRCTCPAGGTCRHILAALIFLKESAPEEHEQHAGDRTPCAGPLDTSTDGSPTAASELLALDDTAIEQWAGKAMVSRVNKALAQGLPVEFEEAAPVIARLSSRNIICRWMPGGGLDGMLCSCHAQGVCEHRVAAVLAFQIARGTRSVVPMNDLAQSASAGAARTREEVLASVGAVVSEMVSLGLSRLSRSSAQRLRTLAVSAHGVDLPRLERLVLGLATQVELALSRDAQADSAILLAQAARVEALRHGLTRHATPTLVGQHQTTYEPVGDIELAGMGARAWRTPSGYAGLTVYFWDRSARKWATWTDARPLSIAGFDPVARYRADGSWAGVSSPAEASCTVIRLVGAWRNRQGRLSGRPSTLVIPLGRADAESIPDRIERWDALADRARAIFSGGFRDRTEQDEIVLISPARWGPPRFDAVRQVLIQVVWDLENRPMPLVLRHENETAEAVNILTAHDPSATRSLLGLLRLGTDGLCLEPITLHTEKGPVNLTLDHAVVSSAQPILDPKEAPSEETEGLDYPGVEDVEPSGTNLSRFLTTVSLRLLAIGEGGPAAFRDIPELKALGVRASALGLASCGQAVGRVVTRLEAQRNGEPFDPMQAARELLQAYHVVRLFLTQEAIAAATAALGLTAQSSPEPSPSPE